MTLQRIRSTVAASLLSVLVLLTAAMPAPGAEAPVLDSQRISAAADSARVLLTGAFGDVAAAVADVGGSIVGHVPLVGAVVAEVPAGSEEQLGDAGGVTTVTENVPLTLQSAEGPPAHATAVGHQVEEDAETHPADSEGPETIGADNLVADGIDGSGVGIAFLDTGVSEVEDLTGRVVPGVDLTVEQDGQDNYGHGTPVAAAAAGDGSASGGTYAGAAPGAHVVPVKIAGGDGVTDLVRVLVGMDWIARHADELGIRVVNISLGGDSGELDLFDAAVQRLWDLGLVVVIAAGNDGAGSISSPAHNNHAITVGATRGHDTESTSDDVVASWSATGLDTDGRAKPDVVAPGQSVVVAGAPGSWAYDEHSDGHLGGGYQRVSGTSFSTGLLSGAAALLVDANPGWTPDEVLGQLLHSSKKVAGGNAGTPWLPAAVSGTPKVANTSASDASGDATTALQDLGPIDPSSLASIVGDEDLAVAYGSGWYGSGWYGSGWYTTDWFGSGWYGSGWYGSGWYGSGWYGSGWYQLGSGWYGSGWYKADYLGSGWYGSGWYGEGFNGSGWYGSGWYGETWNGSGWYGDDWNGSGWYGSGWYGSGWYGSGWYGSGWYGSGWYNTSWYGSGWYGSGWYGSGWYGSGWYGSGWYGSGWY